MNALLLTLAATSYSLGDARAAAVIAGMVVLAITTVYPGTPVNEAAARLRAMVHTTASVRRTPCRTEDPVNSASMLLAYASLTHLVKVWFTRKWGI